MIDCPWGEYYAEVSVKFEVGSWFKSSSWLQLVGSGGMLAQKMLKYAISSFLGTKLSTIQIKDLLWTATPSVQLSAFFWYFPIKKDLENHFSNSLMIHQVINQFHAAHI